MADADLTQYNRVAADAEAENAANALTSQLLLITDNKLITGELNGAAQAPVNRGTKSLANKIAGLRGALWGNVAGIAKRSVKSFYADGTGGATHTKPDGNIHAANNLVAETGDVLSSAGAVEATAGALRAGTAAGERCYTDKAGVHFATIDIPNEYQGVVIEEMGKRGGELQHMDTTPGGELHCEYLIPTRGLIGLKNLLLTRTRGTAVVNNLFDSYKPAHQIDEHVSDHGSLIASESGVSNAYGLNNAQERGTLFIGPAVEVYEGMVVGQNATDTDLELNVTKTKKLTNMRSSGADDAIILTPPRPITLDFAMEFIGPDELLEVTPLSIRIRKKILDANARKRAAR
jgi:hypothetical protein